jgi:hypothetical protein
VQCVDGNKSGSFQIYGGARQGSVLSPVLLNTVMDEMIKIVME